MIAIIKYQSIAGFTPSRTSFINRKHHAINQRYGTTE